MLQQPPKVIIALAAIFIAIISVIAYIIFSFMPAPQRSSIEGPVEGVEQVKPTLSDSSYCADKSSEELPQCCSDWVQKQPNVTIPASCDVQWSIDNNKNCVYTCESASEAAPI